MTQSRHLFSRTGPHISPRLDPQSFPWTALIVLALVIITVIALWGEVPKRHHFPHQTPAENAPGVSSLTIQALSHS